MFDLYKGLSTSKVQSHGSSATSVKQSDLWFESHSALNNADGITTAESKETLSRRGTGETKAEGFIL